MQRGLLSPVYLDYLSRRGGCWIIGPTTVVQVGASMWVKVKRTIIWVISVAAVSFALIWGYHLLRTPIQPRVVELPPASEVASVKAVLEKGSQFGSIPEFTIPPKYVSRILDAFRPATKDNYLSSWGTGLGRLEVITRAGRKIRIQFGFNGHNPICFTVDGVQCIRGGEYKPVRVGTCERDEVYLMECVELECALGLIYSEEKTGRKNKFLNAFLDNLERSAGRRAPKRVKPDPK